MNKMIFAIIVAAAAISSPAIANEGRVEVRGGWIWVPGGSDDALGVALGYDADIGEKTYVGVEISADTNIDFVSPIYSLTGRVGVKAGENTKIFVSGGYARASDVYADDVTIGAGGQFSLGKEAFASVQYQRYIDTQLNRISFGIGLKF